VTSDDWVASGPNVHSYRAIVTPIALNVAVAWMVRVCVLVIVTDSVATRSSTRRTNDVVVFSPFTSLASRRAVKVPGELYRWATDTGLDNVPSDTL